MTENEIAKKVFQHLDSEEIAELALQLANIHGPAGHEEMVSEAVFDWMNANGIPARKLLVAGTRCDVLGTVAGVGGGRNLALNAHMDTVYRHVGEAQTGVEDLAGYRAWRENEKLFGFAALNDRGNLATLMVVAKAIQKSGIRLQGDLVLTAVVGETGGALIEEYQGPEYLGKGIGTRYAIAYGPHVDYALICETTDFGVGWAQCGVSYIKITVTGEQFYVPRIRPFPEMPIHENPSAIIKMSRIIEAVSDWANSYPDNHAVETPCGICRPKVDIGAIRGGFPPRLTETASSCSIYVDVWRGPGVPARDIFEELRGVLAHTGIPVKMEVYLQRNGYIGQHVEPLALAVSRAYRGFTGAEPPAVSEDVLSMWRDTNVYNECGIPSVTFGPKRHRPVAGWQTSQFAKYLIVPDMLLTAKVYVQTALEICGVAPSAV